MTAHHGNVSQPKAFGCWTDTPCEYCSPSAPEESLPVRGGAVVQPPCDGVAQVGGSGRIRSEPAGQRRSWRADCKCWTQRDFLLLDVSGNPLATRNPLCSSTDPGTPFQLWDSGPALEHPSPEDALTPSPGHSLFCSGGRSGSAGEEGVRQRHGSRAPHHHRQSKGKAPAWGCSSFVLIDVWISFTSQPKKLGFTQFSHLRKRKQDDSLDYICPMDTGALGVNGGSPPPSAALRGLGPPRQAEQQQEEVETGAQTGSKQ